MKKLRIVLLTILILALLSDCGSSAVPEKAPDPTSIPEPSMQVSAPAEPSAVPEESPEAAEPVQEEQETAEPSVKTAVVYFSGTGNTRAIAEMIAEASGADLFEILPEQPYTENDLNYNDSTTRATVEQNTPTARPAIANDLSALTDYDIIYLGHPIWWGTRPRILQTFFETYDLSGVTVYTFCTSGSTGIEKSVSDLQKENPTVNIVSGKRLNKASMEDIVNWLSGLGMK